MPPVEGSEVQQTPEQIAADQAAAQQAFDAEFVTAPEQSAPADKLAANTGGQPQPDPAAPGATDGGAPEPAQAPAPPQYVTREELEKTHAEIRKNFGQIGEVTRILKELSTKVAAGGSPATRKLNAEALKKFVERVNDELPGMGDVFAQGLPDILADAAADTQAAQADAQARGQQFDPDAYYTKKLTPALQQMEARLGESVQEALLESTHPNFEATLKEPEFVEYLGQLPAAESDRIKGSPKASVAAAALTDYKAWKAKKAKADEDKQRRLKANINIVGAAGTPTQTGSERSEAEKALVEGFNSA